MQHLITHLATIQSLAKEKLEENNQFKNHLLQQNTKVVDELVFTLNEKITPQINCTTCGNCCKNLMINVEEYEAENVCKHLRISRQKFDEKFIEKGSNGMMLINQIPCHFLLENKCTIYNNRFEGCKEFPALHLPNFNKRLFTIFQSYEICPIVFNVVEELKKII